MHFFYIDESGCTGRDLTNPEQPIFVLGGIIVRDEGWNQTNRDFWQIITQFFNGNVPVGFELHAEDIFSPNGGVFLQGIPRDERNELARNILELLISRKHNTDYCAIDKSRLLSFDTSQVTSKNYLDLQTPYLLAYDYLISLIDFYIKEKRGRSARAMVILDEKDIFEGEISDITQYRRFILSERKRVRHITEFSYAVDSKKNPMIQMADLVCYVIKKYLEIETGYRETYPTEVKNIFRSFYSLIDQRLIKRTILIKDSREFQTYNGLISSVFVFPSARWKTKQY
jgi:hypothetical protein